MISGISTFYFNGDSDIMEEKPVHKPEPKPEPNPEPKSPRVEVAEIKSDEINDTDSLAGFLNDVKQIVEDKGIKVDTSNQGMFTLFEDASEVEK